MSIVDVPRHRPSWQGRPQPDLPRQALKAGPHPTSASRSSRSGSSGPAAGDTPPLDLPCLDGATRQCSVAVVVDGVVVAPETWSQRKPAALVKMLALAPGYRLRRELPFDLFLGVPVHRAPDVVHDSGMCVDGWIPVDPLTLETAFPQVYSLGDVTSVGTPKAGVFAEGQAAIVADRIIAHHRGATPESTYGGTGTCYIEFGHEAIGRVEVTFRQGEHPVGRFDNASEIYRADK